MRAWIAVVLACLGCGAKKEPLDARAAAVVDACARGAWYPGVTDAAAPRAHLTVHLVNGLPEGVAPVKVGTQSGVCLVIDGKALLSPKDQALIDARAAKKETVTWDGTVAPGEHTIGVALVLPASTSVSGRTMTVTKGGIVTIGVAGAHGEIAWGADGDVTLGRIR